MVCILADNTKNVNCTAGLPAEALGGGGSGRCRFGLFNYLLGLLMDRYFLRGYNPRFYEEIMDGIRRLGAHLKPMLRALLLQFELIRVRIKPPQIIQITAIELGSLLRDHYPERRLVLFPDPLEFNG